MKKDSMKRLLTRVRDRRLSIDEALARLRHLPYEDLGFAKVDHHRSMRTGFPEVVYCPGKTRPQILGIFKALVRRHGRVLLTRAEPGVFRCIRRVNRSAVYHELARAITVEPPRCARAGQVVVLCAGTADIPVAEEAAVTAEISGSRVERIYDVGVAGLHRVLDCLPRLAQSRCIVVVAGMDGALPSVIGGLAACPVIAVPTSVGYGAHFGGIAPLLTMLNSCASQVAVVNIDNGFGAGRIASMINGLAERRG